MIQTLQAEHKRFEKGEIENAPEIVSTPSPVLSPGIDARLARTEAHLERLSEALSSPERHKA